MILPILTHPNDLLRKKAGKIKNPLDPEIQALIPAMLETMRSAKGLGLAAPQVGRSIRLCLVEEEGKPYILINPQIKSRSRASVVLEEGCLSIPGKFFKVTRPEQVKVRYLDETGKESKMKAQGLLARALQHEIDHLDGILVIDHIVRRRKK